MRRMTSEEAIESTHNLIEHDLLEIADEREDAWERFVAGEEIDFRLKGPLDAMAHRVSAEGIVADPPEEFVSDFVAYLRSRGHTVRLARERDDKGVVCYVDIQPELEDERDLKLLEYIQEGEDDDLWDHIVWEDMQTCTRVCCRPGRDFMSLVPAQLAAHPEAVEDALRLYAHLKVPPERVGRNDPCPCASGKKFKRCCGA